MIIKSISQPALVAVLAALALAIPLSAQATQYDYRQQMVYAPNGTGSGIWGTNVRRYFKEYEGPDRVVWQPIAVTPVVTRKQEWYPAQFVPNGVVQVGTPYQYRWSIPQYER
jgi:hypothetical protein